MTSSTEALWEINNEYRKRLSLLMGHMKLLEELLKVQGSADPALRAAIRRARATLEEIDADHHEWRHTFYYQQPEDQQKRRMVTDPAAVRRALQTFQGMLGEHLAQYAAIAQTLAALPRPDPALTRVIRHNDLWEMCVEGIQGLAAYDRFVQEQLSGRPRRFP